MEKIGIDVHKIATEVCVLTEDGEYVGSRIRTERASLDEAFGNRKPARILLEAATESEWVARHLEGLGHEVIVADPNFAPMYASRSRKIKTDKRDARALCDACELGNYRHAHRSRNADRLLRKSVAAQTLDGARGAGAEPLENHLAVSITVAPRGCARAQWRCAQLCQARA